MYIGEAESVLKRVAQHTATKDFWQEVVIVTSKDETLTKAHVKYLEYRLVQKVQAIGRARLVNTAAPSDAALPRADRAAMEEFLDNIGVLLGALGHRLLVPMVAPPTEESKGDERFRYAVKGAEAFGTVTDEGFVVFKGSTGLLRSNDSMGPGNIALKQELLATGKLQPDGERVRFMDNLLFGTPSQAGALISGTSCNGRVAWRRCSDQRTIKELDEAMAPSA